MTNPNKLRLFQQPVRFLSRRLELPGDANRGFEFLFNVNVGYAVAEVGAGRTQCGAQQQRHFGLEVNAGAETQDALFIGLLKSLLRLPNRDVEVPRHFREITEDEPIAVKRVAELQTPIDLLMVRVIDLELAGWIRQRQIPIRLANTDLITDNKAACKLHAESRVKRRDGARVFLENINAIHQRAADEMLPAKVDAEIRPAKHRA